MARGEPEHGTGIFGSIARSFTRSAAPAVVALVASAAVAGLVTAQEAPPTRTDTVGETIIDRVDVELVNVEVTVTDGDGKPISDSTHILEALERFKPDPPIIPRRGGERARAMELESYLDETLGDAVRTVIVGPAFSEAPVDTIRMLTTGMAPA